MVSNYMLIKIPFFVLFSEILLQEMFLSGLRVELRSHRPPTWSHLIYPPWPEFHSLLISSSNILTLLSTQVADFGLARDLTECEYYRKTGDGKVTIMKSMIMATFITLIQSDEWKSTYLLETFFIYSPASCQVDESWEPFPTNCQLDVRLEKLGRHVTCFFKRVLISGNSPKNECTMT